MKSIRIAFASLAIAFAAPAAAHAGGIEDMVIQGIVGAVVDGMTGGQSRGYRSYQQPSYGYVQPSYGYRQDAYAYDDYREPSYGEMRQMTREYYYERYGRPKVQACANNRRCARELDRVGRSGSQREMDRFFSSF